MAWRRLSESPAFGTSPPPWRPHRLDAHLPPGISPSTWRKRTLCRLRIETLLDGAVISDFTTGWDYDVPFEVTNGAFVSNSSGGNNEVRYTLEAAAGIGAPWRYIFEDKTTDSSSVETFDVTDWTITPGSSLTITYSAPTDGFKQFSRAMLCLPA